LRRLSRQEVMMVNQSLASRMTLAEQAARRVRLAHDLGRAPVRWIATPEAIDQLRAGAEADAWGTAGAVQVFHGVPIDIGSTRSEWGLDLVCAP